MKKIALLLAIFAIGVQAVLAQTKEISGTVTSAEDGSTIPGVSVSVKGTTLGTITDLDGKFVLNVPERSETLVFSFVGLQTKEVSLTSENTYNVSLQSDVIGVDEVLVVAYGTAKKSSITGATAVIKSDDIAKIQTSNVTRTLEGTTAGVQITSNTGQPGEDAKIRIRGIGSINASSEPLIVVDGAPYEGALNSINTNDIESMTVLKDAASNSLYGSRGANGVILITTKRGKEGKTKVSFSAKGGINSRAIPEYDIMTDPRMYYETYWQALKNSRTYAGKTDSESALYASETLISDLVYNAYDVEDAQLVGIDGKLNPNAKLRYYDNWGDEMFNNGTRQEYNVSISGGNETTSNFLSIGYINDEGYSVNSDFERLSARLNVDHKINEWLKVGVNSSYVTSEQNYPERDETAGVNMFYISRLMAPIYPVYQRDTDGNLIYDEENNIVHDYGEDPARPFSGLSNPLGSQTYDTDQWTRNVFTNNIFTEVSFLNHFNFRASVNSTLEYAHHDVYLNGKYGQYQSNEGISSKYQYKTNTLNAQQLLTYAQDFNEHSIDVLAGHETFEKEINYLYAQKEYFLLPDNHELAGAIKNPRTNSHQRNYRTEGYLSRVKYNYKSKYYLSGSFRRDASSKFHPDNRWGNFWSIGGSWRITEEDFINEADWLDDLKLKISYGTQGNDGILDPQGYVNYQPYLDQYEVGNTNDQPSLVQVYKGNRDLTWEKSKTFNTGIEYSMFRGRLDGSLEFFTRTASDLLFNRPLPSSTGDRTYPDNVGDMRNTGFEFLISGDIVRNKDFTWNITLNATHYKNEVTKLPPESIENGIGRGNYKLTVGGSIYDYYMPKYAGVEETTGKPLWYMDVLDEEGKVTSTTTTTVYNDATYYVLENSIPDIYGGISSNITFKGLDFSFKLAYQLGGKTFDNVYRNLMHGGSDTGQNFHKDIQNSWTPENTNTNIPALNSDDSFINRTSDRWLISSSFLNVANATLGYTLPSRWTESISIANARVYIVGDNLALFTKRKGMDSRMNFDGDVEFFASPIRTVSLGVDVTF